MDNYLIINTIQLSFTITMFTEGRLKPGIAPPWLLWLYAMCTVGAFMYILLSVWLAMHASIAAHSFGVRMLTQFVRLPVPQKKQLDAARATATDFEASRADTMLRIPVLQQQLRRMRQAMANVTVDDFGDTEEADTSADDGEENPNNPAVMLKHVQLYRQLQANWQAYDAYSRVCMAMGTNQLLHALGYFVLGNLIGEDHAPWAALSCIVAFTMAAWLLARLDLYLSLRYLVLAGVLLFTGPFLTMISITLKIAQAHENKKAFHADQILVPLTFIMHIAWLIFIYKTATAAVMDKIALPTKWRAVLYLDVYGWLAPSGEEQSATTNTMSVQTASPTTTTSVMPPQMRASLVDNCWKIQQSLNRDLDRWESADVVA